MFLPANETAFAVFVGNAENIGVSMLSVMTNAATK
jgi:hypothetical protein